MIDTNGQLKYKGSATERIMKAIMGEPPVHDLQKEQCEFCEAWITKKGMEEHLSHYHWEEGDRSRNDYE